MGGGEAVFAGEQFTIAGCRPPTRDCEARSGRGGGCLQGGNKGGGGGEEDDVGGEDGFGAGVCVGGESLVPALWALVAERTMREKRHLVG